MRIKLALMEALPAIIEQSVKPLENIDGIRILHVDGLNGGGAGGGASGTGGGSEGGLADQVVSSALRYRSQAPLVDAMLSEIGLKAGDPSSLADAFIEKVTKPDAGSDAEG